MVTRIKVFLSQFEAVVLETITARPILLVKKILSFQCALSLVLDMYPFIRCAVRMVRSCNQPQITDGR